MIFLWANFISRSKFTLIYFKLIIMHHHRTSKGKIKLNHSSYFMEHQPTFFIIELLTLIIC